MYHSVASRDRRGLLVRWCPRPPGDDATVAHSHHIQGFSGILRFGFEKYRADLAIPPVVVSTVIYLLGWLPTLTERFGLSGPVASMLEFPFGLIVVAVPVSFISIVVQVLLTRDTVLYGSARSFRLLVFAKGIWLASLLLTIAYLSLVALVKWAYASFVSDVLTHGLASFTISMDLASTLFFSNASAGGWYLAYEMADLYNIGITRMSLVSNVFLTVPLQVLYWFALISVAFGKARTISSLRAVCRTMRRNFKYTAMYMLMAVTFFTIAQLTLYASSAILESFISRFGFTAASTLKIPFDIALYAMKVLVTPLMFLWAAAIYQTSQEGLEV